MCVRRVASAKYLAAGFVISTFIIVAGTASQANAQVDPNLQERVTTFSPPITVLSPEVNSKAIEAGIQKGDKAPCSQDPWYKDMQRYLTGEHPPGFKPELIIPSPDFKCGPQIRKISISAPFNPTYETNVLKSDTNIHSDGSWGFGGSVLFTGPGLDGRNFDIVAFNAQSASARYWNFPSKSFDAVTEQGLYQIYLGAYHNDGKPIDEGKLQYANLLTIDTLGLGFVNQTTYLPGYHVETADLLTPQFTLARQNIDLDPNKARSCLAPKAGQMPGDEITRAGFCYYLDLALTVGQTFSDVPTLENVNVALSATPGWRVDGTNWKIALPMVATAKEYEEVLGGRQDVLLQIGPTASYTLPTAQGAPSLMFSLAASYNRNYSTLSTAAWHGYIIQPTLTVAFQPLPAVK
jgi:hypothetical protein